LYIDEEDDEVKPMMINKKYMNNEEDNAEMKAIPKKNDIWRRKWWNILYEEPKKTWNMASNVKKEICKQYN